MRNPPSDGLQPEPTLADKLRALGRPSAYPHRCASVKTIETHFAAVFLAGEFAYKLKKPVRMERMDFRELAARERACREEVRLNRRLAADVYLDVVPVHLDAQGSMRIDGCGKPIDWLVKMRALPEERMLDRAIASDTVTHADVASAARLLACFYREQPPVEFTDADYLRRLHHRVDDARAQLRAPDLGLEAGSIDVAIAQQKDYLRNHAQQVGQRALENRMVEGHGDLRPEHIFLGAPPLAACVIDCLEFDRDLRIFDPVEELAFFALECGRMNAAWIGAEFIAAYRSITGDEWPSPLFDFYRRQRALTRAKIAAWHLRDPSVVHLADWRELARSYVDDALQTA